MINMENLNEIYKRHSHSNDYGDKGTAHSYIETYENLFNSIRVSATNVLEIGCFYGHSLRMWREYFVNAQIDSVEINPELCFEEERIKVYNGDSNDLNFANQKFKDNYYDVIIDDGLHTFDSQINTFKAYFSKLKEGGIYVIEDVYDLRDEEFRSLHSSYRLYDLTYQRAISDNRLVVYIK